MLNESYIDEMYYCRELQMRRILEEASKSARDEAVYMSESAKLLDAVLTTPPDYLDYLLSKLSITKEELFDRITPASVASARDGKVISILMSLVYACDHESRRVSEIAIDQMDSVLPASFQVIFREDMPKLEEIAAEGASQAAIGALRLVQGDIPLLRYRRDLVQNRIRLQPGVNGGELGSLTTKVPGVDVRYFYARNSLIPVLSFVVKPFE